MQQTKLKNKRVLVMGLGSFGGGADSAAFACGQGAQVTVTDLADEAKLGETIQSLRTCPIQWHLGRHEDGDFRTSDVVIVNPAVPPDNRYLQIARAANAVVTSQVQLFFERCPARIAAITGSNGKSTTTALTAHLLEAGCGQKGIGYDRVFLSGNIGNRPLLGLLESLTERDVVVIEISSFQLEQLAVSRLGSYAAVLTNLSPNHLDRHRTFEAYCAAKENIFAWQPTDGEKPAVSIMNAEDPLCLQWYAKYSGQPGRRCVLFRAEDVPAAYQEHFALPGRVNLQNLAAALAVTEVFGVDPQRLAKGIASFKGLDNRMQLVAETEGVRWYDDSKATTPISTMAALNGMEEPKILIAGGYDKGISFDELGQCIARRCKAVVLIGQTAGKIAESIKKAGQSDVILQNAKDMPDAVSLCSRVAQKGDVVLMSPACASYDMFKNYQERGKVFRDSIPNGRK
jgi:UDP-N-acetylmuramoylalanine--D-glutamate ligase